MEVRQEFLPCRCCSLNVEVEQVIGKSRHIQFVGVGLPLPGHPRSGALSSTQPTLGFVQLDADLDFVGHVVSEDDDRRLPVERDVGGVALDLAFETTLAQSGS